MKTWLVPFCFFLVLFESKSQIVEKQSTTIEAYYGFPDFYKIAYRSLLGTSGTLNINTKGQGPFGLRMDHILTNRLGIGADVWYVNTKITGVHTPSNQPSGTSTVNFNANLMRINFLLRATFHIAKHEKFDPYFHFGLGYLYSRFNFESTNRALYNVSNPLLPVSIRAGMGLKYYFSPEFGVVVDAGFPGPFISIGVFKRWLNKEENENN